MHRERSEAANSKALVLVHLVSWRSGPSGAPTTAQHALPAPHLFCVAGPRMAKRRSQVVQGTWGHIK
jgi:hypothetical protein